MLPAGSVTNHRRPVVEQIGDQAAAIIHRVHPPRLASSEWIRSSAPRINSLRARGHATNKGPIVSTVLWQKGGGQLLGLGLH